jgi:hypothetical protein
MKMTRAFDGGIQGQDFPDHVLYLGGMRVSRSIGQADNGQTRIKVLSHDREDSFLWDGTFESTSERRLD